MTEKPQDILDVSVRSFIASTAAKSPTPGGGSVAALAGALAGALAQMALQYTVGKRAFAAHQEKIAAALERLRKAGELFEELVYEDIEAYGALSAVLKLPPEERVKSPTFLPAVVAAIRAPQAVGALALSVLETCESMRESCNPLLLSDLAIAACLSRATAEASEFNVLVNLSLLPDPNEAAEIRQKMHELVSRADAAWERVRSFACGRIAG